MYKLLYSQIEGYAGMEEVAYDWEAWGKYSSYEEALITLMRAMLEDRVNKDDFAYRIVKAKS